MDMGTWNDITSSAAANQSANGCNAAEFSPTTNLQGPCYYCYPDCATMGWIDNSSKSFDVYQ